MLHMKSITVAALSALVTVSTIGAVAQQNPVPQEGVESPEVQKLDRIAPSAGMPATAIKIDASNATNFKTSLDAIRKALPKQEKKELEKAIETLADKGDESLTASVKNTLKSDEDVVFAKHGQKLDGKNYKAILHMAG